MAEWRDNEAALVAARLKRFALGPAEFGARLARGEESMPEGAAVLRFAQGRFPPGWPEGEMQPVRSAAAAFIRQVCLREGADHYEVLCVSRQAAGEAIKENYHLLMGLLHPDRQDTAASWPDGCAQRVNVAYAALGDEASRRAYDATLPRPSASSFPPRRTRQRSRAMADTRFARALLVVCVVMAAVVAAMLVVHEDDWSDRTLMDSAIAALRKRPSRSVEHPRFVGANLEPARAMDALDDSPVLPLIEPLMRRLRGEEAMPWIAAPTIVAPQEARARTFAATTSPPVVPAGDRIQPPPARLVQASPPAISRSDAPDLAQRPPVSVAPTNQDIETLVVALIGYYEAGDAERLVGLLDTQRAGYWRTAQLRQSYDDFFRATRARRLRLERLAWNSQPGSASAKGEATVVAEYFDQNAPVERHVPVELDVGVRDGRVLITRLALFPVAK